MSGSLRLHCINLTQNAAQKVPCLLPGEVLPAAAEFEAQVRLHHHLEDNLQVGVVVHLGLQEVALWFTIF